VKALNVFRYKSIRGKLAPLITIGMKLKGIWYPIEVYVDSGAAYTLLHAQMAEGVDFDYRIGLGNGSIYRLATRVSSLFIYTT